MHKSNYEDNFSDLIGKSNIQTPSIIRSSLSPNSQIQRTKVG